MAPVSSVSTRRDVRRQVHRGRGPRRAGDPRERAGSLARGRRGKVARCARRRGHRSRGGRGPDGLSPPHPLRVFCSVVGVTPHQVPRACPASPRGALARRSGALGHRNRARGRVHRSVELRADVSSRGRARRTVTSQRSHSSDHNGLQVRDRQASIELYTAAVAPFGHLLGSQDAISADFGSPGAPRSPRRTRVEAGGRDHGKPGLGKDHSPTYCAAFLPRSRRQQRRCGVQRAKPGRRGRPPRGYRYVRRHCANASRIARVLGPPAALSTHVGTTGHQRGAGTAARGRADHRAGTSVCATSARALCRPSHRAATRGA